MRRLLIGLMLLFLLITFIPKDEYLTTDEVFVNESVSLSAWITPNDVSDLADNLTNGVYSSRAKTLRLYSYVSGLEFLSDSGSDTWQIPSETIKRGGGDCEDLSFLLVSLMRASKIRNIYLIIGVVKIGDKVTSRFLGNGHMWVEYGNLVYETTSYKKPFNKEQMDNEYYTLQKILVR